MATHPALVRSGDAARFLTRVEPFLVAEEAANCLALGLLANLATVPAAGGTYLAAVESGDAVVGSAILAGGDLVLSAPWPTAASAALAVDLEAAAVPVPGVLGGPDAVDAFVRRWTRLRGCRTRPGIAQRIYRLERVLVPAGVPGRLRRAGPADRPLLVAWLIAFSAEALGESSPEPQAGAVVDRYLAGPPRGLYLWEDGGRPVSMAGVSGPTPHGIRVNAVYTPPASRGRGYASACVAAVSQAQLDSGRRFCFLFTDLANSTSNHIYQAIGYEPICDVAQARFVGLGRGRA